MCGSRRLGILTVVMVSVVTIVLWVVPALPEISVCRTVVDPTGTFLTLFGRNTSLILQQEVVMYNPTALSFYVEHAHLLFYFQNEPLALVKVENLAFESRGKTRCTIRVEVMVSLGEAISIGNSFHHNNHPVDVMVNGRFHVYMEALSFPSFSLSLELKRLHPNRRHCF